MTLITTVAELDALPVGAVVLDHDGDTWVKDGAAWVLRGRLHVRETALFISAQYGPFELTVDTSIAADAALSPELRSTRCCGHDCQDTALLRPGSTYLCPDHGDCSADIRKEQATNER
jgi:hypothetical protein